MIQKIAISDAEDFIEKLREHAVPAYFDKIESASDENNRVYAECYINDTVFLKIYYTQAEMTITTSAGATVETTGSGYAVKAIYVCKNGILLHHALGSDYSYYDSILISKDKNDKTCVATDKTHISTIPVNIQSYSIYAASVDDAEIMEYTCQFNKKDELTGKYAFNPIYTQESYIVGCYFPFMYQYAASTGNASTTIKVTLDGTEYLCDPLFALKDE